MELNENVCLFYISYPNQYQLKEMYYVLIFFNARQNMCPKILTTHLPGFGPVTLLYARCLDEHLFITRGFLDFKRSSFNQFDIKIKFD